MNTIDIEYFKKKLEINQSAEVRVISDSMRPLIHTGEVLQVKPISTKIRRFDIIIFDYHGAPMCHFFWARTPRNKICTKSLKNPSHNDLPIEENKVLGIVQNKKINLLHKLIIYLIVILRGK